MEINERKIYPERNQKTHKTILFKAQLFVPYQQDVNFDDLNEDCICGFYLKSGQLEDFKACQFYIP